MIDLFLTLAEFSAAEVSATTKDEEADLVARAQSDPSEFTALYQKYVRPVFYYLLSKSGSRSAAEDLTARVFLDALESLPAYRHQGHFAAWLFTIARHRLADFHRQRQVELPFDHLQHVDGQAVDPLAQIVHAEHIQRLGKLVRELKESERELLRLRFAAGLSFAEIAALQGRKESAMKMSYYRLLARLQSQMEADDA